MNLLCVDVFNLSYSSTPCRILYLLPLDIAAHKDEPSMSPKFFPPP